jgi:vitellogenic carboxypeptidase-like protein
VASDLFDALQQFFTLFPDLRNNNDFFVTGESYAGKYVPAITFKIHTMNEATKDKNKLINLKVICMGVFINDVTHLREVGWYVGRGEGC